MASLRVTVDDDFARFGGKSYAINKINSVEVRERHPHGSGGAILFGGLSMILLVAALNGTDPNRGPTFLLLAALSAVAAYWAWRRSKVVEYQLFLMTSSSEAQAFVSRDGNEVYSLRDNIERAMTKRP